MKKIFLILFILPFLLTSCASIQQKHNEQVRVLVSATKKSIEAKRFDLANEYTKQLDKLVGPPKKEVKINKFIPSISIQKDGIFTKEELSKPKTFIVLPEGFDVVNVISKNSEEYNNLLKNDKVLQKTEKENDKNILQTEIKTNNIISKIYDKGLKGDNGNWLSKSWKFISNLFGIGVIGSIIILILIIIFAPELLPVITFLFKYCVNLMKSILKMFSQ